MDKPTFFTFFFVQQKRHNSCRGWRNRRSHTRKRVLLSTQRVLKCCTYFSSCSKSTLHDREKIAPWPKRFNSKYFQITGVTPRRENFCVRQDTKSWSNKSRSYANNCLRYILNIRGEIILRFTLNHGHFADETCEVEESR